MGKRVEKMENDKREGNFHYANELPPPSLSLSFDSTYTFFKIFNNFKEYMTNEFLLEKISINFIHRLS